METELKLSFSSIEAIDRLWSNTIFSSYKLPDSEKEMDFETIYYDTVDFILQQKMASLRVRKIVSAGFIHTVKIKAEEKDGLHQRYEWNFETEMDSFDIDFFLAHAISDGDPPGLLINILERIRDEELQKLFTTNFHRKIVMLDFRNSLIEAASDSGIVSIDSRFENFCEMELELKKGDVCDVVALGNEILAQTNSKLDNKSKYQRGMSLLKEMKANNEF